uniref:Hydrocephalus-inducing protein n=1 Tax=Lygus hesperus TaxID=30085 RepID=A0A0A9YQ88_LYGHE
MQYVTLDVTLDASGSATHTEEKHDTNSGHAMSMTTGRNVFPFTLDIKGGPVVIVQCQCYIATPTLKLDCNELSFDAVLLGQVRVMPLTLTNEQAVPCAWAMTYKEYGNNNTAKSRGNNSNTINRTIAKSSNQTAVEDSVF